MGFDYSADGISAFTIVMMVVAIVSTIVRFWSRAVVLAGDYGWDDWFALLATIFLVAQLALNPVLKANGLGKEIFTQVSYAQIVIELKTFLACCLLNTAGITFSKLSVLVFYCRIFGFRKNVNKTWQASVWLAGFLTIAYAIFTFCVNIWACKPIAKFWNPFLPGKCLSNNSQFISYSVFALVIDVLILIMPLPELYRLKIKTPRKIALTVAFIIGYSVPAITIGRLVTVLILGDELNTEFPRALVAVGWWFQAEAGITIFAISTPPMLKLYLRAVRYGPGALFHSRQYDRSHDRSDGESASSSSKGWRVRFRTKQSDASGSTVSSEGSDPRLNRWFRGRAVSEAKTDAPAHCEESHDANCEHPEDHICMERQYVVTYDT